MSIARRLMGVTKGVENLLLNSDPFSGTSNWRGVNAGLSESGGVLTVDDNGAYGAGQQAVAVTPGASYRLSGIIYTDGTAGQVAVLGIKQGDRETRAELSDLQDPTPGYQGTAPFEASFEFTATQSFVTVKLVSVSDNNSYFENVTLIPT